MKLRIKGNSARLRLTKSEVELFAKKGLVEEISEFGAGEDQRFVYALESSKTAESARAVFENNRLSILLPESQADEWTQTADLVGIRAEQPLEGGKIFSILVEKDFACLQERPGEDDSDAFPHTDAAKIC
jgi:hypothetical protein